MQLFWDYRTWTESEHRLKWEDRSINMMTGNQGTKIIQDMKNAVPRSDMDTRTYIQHGLAWNGCRISIVARSAKNEQKSHGHTHCNAMQCRLFGILFPWGRWVSEPSYVEEGENHRGSVSCNRNVAKQQGAVHCIWDTVHEFNMVQSNLPLKLHQFGDRYGLGSGVVQKHLRSIWMVCPSFFDWRTSRQWWTKHSW